MEHQINSKRICCLMICLFLSTSVLVAESGFVTDKKTGLKWIKGEAGAMSWSAAVEYCDTLQMSGYSDWRLPTIDELGLSYTLKESFPGFPDDSNAYYWSSTVNQNYPEYAHGMYADGGYTFDDGHKESEYLVRCVRNRLKASCISGDCKNGFGVYIFSNGDKYEGAWENGKRHGYGVYTWASGKQFKGEFRENRRVQ